VGKTDVGFFIARELGGEIISCDSMLVYRELSIATSKPPQSMLQSIPHHLIDAVSVTQDFDAARFNALADQAKEDIRRRQKPVVVVGGSGMYMQILLDGIFTEETRRPELRLQIQKRIEAEGNAAVYAELKEIDPAAAAKIHPNDSRRIIRALEVFYSADKTISQMQKARQGWWGAEDIRIFMLNRPRAELYERINLRVEEMFEQGLEKEIRALEGVKLSRSAQAIIGIKELRKFIAGECSLAEAKEEMKMNTRRLAKRQMTWFRKEKRLTWLDIGEGESAPEVAQRILTMTA